MHPDWTRRAATSPAAVAAVVAAFYAGFTLLALALHGWNPLWFLWLGERFAALQPGGPTGYDGQFFYYIARDGWAAVPHLDNAPYRMQRIGLPLLARLLAGGHADRLPWAIIAINFTAITATALALAAWLRRQGLSPWYGLGYALYAGVFLAYSRALCEPLAMAFATGAVLCWLGERIYPAVGLLAAAILTKEIAALFAAGIAAAELVRRRPARAALMLTALAPYALWRWYLATSLGGPVLEAARALEHWPLVGILPHITAEPGRLSALLFVGLPALALLPVALWHLARAPRACAAWLLVLHCAAVVLFPPEVFDHIMAAGRNAAGLVISALLLFPLAPPRGRTLLLVCWLTPTLIWLAPVLYWAPW